MLSLYITRISYVIGAQNRQGQCHVTLRVSSTGPTPASFSQFLPSAPTSTWLSAFTWPYGPLGFDFRLNLNDLDFSTPLAGKASTLSRYIRQSRRYSLGGGGQVKVHGYLTTTTYEVPRCVQGEYYD